MITIDVSLLKNQMNIDEEGRLFFVKPVGWDVKGIKGALTRYLTTEYVVFDSNDDIIGTVKYDGKKDQVEIKKGDDIYNTKHRWLEPDEFKYKGKTYQIHEKMSGKLIITHKEKVMAEAEFKTRTVLKDVIKSKSIQKVAARGKWGFTTMKFERYDEELKDILKFVGVGYIIKIMLVLMII